MYEPEELPTLIEAHEEPFLALTEQAAGIKLAKLVPDWYRDIPPRIMQILQSIDRKKAM